MVEKFPSALHCIHKHLTAAKKGTEETLAKLYKECEKEVCKVSSATRSEAEEVVSDLNKAESHCAEVLSKLEIPELRGFYDEIRAVRKKIYETNLPYQGEFKVLPKTIGTFEEAYRRIGELLHKLGKIAEEKYEKLKEISCPKCEEELERKVKAFKAVVKGVEEGSFSVTKSYKSNPIHNPVTMAEVLEKSVKPLADWLGIDVTDLSPALWGELFAVLGEIPIDILTKPLGSKIAKGIVGLILSLGMPHVVVGKDKFYFFESGSHFVAQAADPRPEELAKILREARELGRALGALDWEGVKRILLKEEPMRGLEELAAALKGLAPTPTPEVPEEFVCEICGETFPTTEALEAHRATVHPEVILPPPPVRRFIT